MFPSPLESHVPTRCWPAARIASCGPITVDARWIVSRQPHSEHAGPQPARGGGPGWLPCHATIPRLLEPNRRTPNSDSVRCHLQRRTAISVGLQRGSTASETSPARPEPVLPALMVCSRIVGSRAGGGFLVPGVARAWEMEYKTYPASSLCESRLAGMERVSSVGYFAWRE
jgi:hypothetical protein